MATKTTNEAPAEVTPAQELERLAKHIREHATRRQAREAELAELMSKSPLDMLDDADAVSEDAARLQTQLGLIDRGINGAKARCRALYPIASAEIEAVGDEIQRLQAEMLETVRRNATKKLAEFFSAEALPHVVNRTKAVAEQMAFNATHRPPSDPVNMVFSGGPNPVPVPSDDNNPGAVANALRRCQQYLEETRKRAEEVRRKYAR